MTRTQKLLIAELLLLFLCIPVFIIVNSLSYFMFMFLYAGLLYTILVFGRYHRIEVEGIWRWGEVNWTNLKPILLRWGLAVVGMLVFTYFYDPDRLFYIPNERPQIIPAILIGYPFFSALPQEFIYCTFFFTRYKTLFKTNTHMIAASAILFAIAHILFINPVAPPLSLIGGIIFAATYAKTKSLALVTIEHGLYGNALFMIGLGWYFYHGSVL